MRETLEQILEDFYTRPLPNMIPRETAFPVLKGKANVIIGMRRSGKTWYCYQRMRALLAQGVAKERLLYINFEDDRLNGFTADHFQLLLETYSRLYPNSQKVGSTLFLDEPQGIPGWERFVRRVLDTGTMDICVTGSSAKLLSTEIATSLRGRALTTEIFPFSFSEFLAAKGHVVPVTQRYDSDTRGHLENWIKLYKEEGGFPDVQDISATLRRDVLRSYVDVVILRDVIERHRVRNVVALRALVHHILSSPANRFSVNKFYNRLRSQRITCTKNDLYAFLDHLTDAYLIFSVPIHSRSAAVRRVNPMKLYAVDTGLLSDYTARVDDGASLENLVFLDARRRGWTAEYLLTATGREVDFVFVRPDGGRELIQVCWSMSDPKTRQREVTALQEGLHELKLQKGTIISWLEEETIGKNISVIPAWKWFLRASSDQ